VDHRPRRPLERHRHVPAAGEALDPGAGDGAHGLGDAHAGLEEREEPVDLGLHQLRRPVRGRDDLEDARGAADLERVHVALERAERPEVALRDAVEARGLREVLGRRCGLGRPGHLGGRRPVRCRGRGAVYRLRHPPCLPGRAASHGVCVLIGSISMPPPHEVVVASTATYDSRTATSMTSPQTLSVASMTSPTWLSEATWGAAVNSMSKTLSWSSA